MNRYYDKYFALGDAGDIEAIENERGCKMEEMTEGDLLEILYDNGIEAIEAEFDGSDWINYNVDETEYSNEPDPMDLAKEELLEYGLSSYSQL